MLRLEILTIVADEDGNLSWMIDPALRELKNYPEYKAHLLRFLKLTAERFEKYEFPFGQPREGSEDTQVEICPECHTELHNCKHGRVGRGDTNTANLN